MEADSHNLKEIDTQTLIQLGMGVAIQRLLSPDCGPQDVNAYFTALQKTEKMRGHVQLPDAIMAEVNAKIAESHSRVSRNASL